MKKNMKLNFMLMSGVLLFGMYSCTPGAQDYSSYVNPFIGTGGHGHTYPGAVVPNGMIQPSPDTRIYQWDACSGYYYADSTMNGFSHTHLNGTGCGDYGDVLLMPTVGKQDYHAMGEESQQMAYASAFSHDNEVAQPGYYSVFLDRYQVKAELTATKRAAIHRYTFPKAEDAGFILDLDYSLQRQKNEEMELEVISDTEIRGRKKTVYWAFDQYINFYAKFSKPFTYTLVTDSMALDEGGPLFPTAKALLQFQTENNEEVLVKVGVSAVDMDGARKNVEAEIPEWDFNGVRSAARESWNNYLAKIDIETSDKDQRVMFYTALYHTGVQPNLFTDADDDDFEDDDFEDDFEEEDIPKKSRWKKRKEKSSKNKWEQDFSEDIGGEAVARKRSPIISFLLFIFILIFLGSVGYLGYYYWKSAQNRSTYQSLREVYDNPGFLAPAGYPSGYDKDFAGLWEINPDIVGWINIDGTGLDYPVVQTTDNTKYYRMNFEGEYSEHAVPFVDAAVDLKKPSTNTIIYGHNIRTDGQMFNILKGYKELEYYQQHPVVEFNSVYHKGQYKIISVFYTNTHSEHGEIFPYHEFIDSQSEAQTQEYIDDVLIRSIINTGVDVLPSDELLTLSTCTYEFKDARYVVVARKVRKGESADVDTSQASMNPNPLYPDVWYQLFGGTKPDEAQLKANLHS